MQSWLGLLLVHWEIKKYFLNWLREGKRSTTTLGEEIELQHRLTTTPAIEQINRITPYIPTSIGCLMMKDFAIEFSRSWQDSPLAYWVHIEQDNQPWLDAEAYNPPAPKSDLGSLYKIYKVEIDGFTFRFSSIEQLEHCIEIFSLESLPTTITLSEKRQESEGPNAHWLSTLPAHVKSWRYRQKAVKYLSKVREELKNNL